MTSLLPAFSEVIFIFSCLHFSNALPMWENLRTIVQGCLLFSCGIHAWQSVILKISSKLPALFPPIKKRDTILYMYFPNANMLLLWFQESLIIHLVAFFQLTTLLPESVCYELTQWHAIWSLNTKVFLGAHLWLTGWL